MVVEAGGLPWQPTDHPYVIVQTVMQALIPAMFDAQPHPIHPTIGGRKQRNDVDEFLRGPGDRAGSAPLLSMYCLLHV